MDSKSINNREISELHQEKVSLAKIKKVQFFGDKAIVIIDKALVEQLAIDNKTYLREEIAQDGSIVLRIEPFRPGT